MAEAIAAFSLAANVIQFIDFCSKIASNYYGLHKAGSRLKDEASELNIISRDLEKILKDLQAPTQETSVDGTGLGQLAQECQKCARNLDEKLQPLLKARSQQLGKREAIKVALRAVWNEDEIRSLQDQLEKFRSQLTLHLLASLREMANQSIVQQKEILSEVRSISKHPMGTRRDADDLTSPILDFLTSKVEPHKQGESKTQLKLELIAAIHGDSVENGYHDVVAKQQIPSITADRAKRLQAQILRSLSYAGMENREERIAEAYGATFEWIFEDSHKDQQKWSNFKNWLVSDSQLYWITGKPGSGKSTLMKYICHSEEKDEQLKANTPSRCTEHLLRWTGNSRLIIGTFFFWNSGMRLQMQEEGLLRTLLFQLLKQNPHLIQIIAPKRWEALCLIDEDPLDWSHKELQGMLKLLVKKLTENEKLCLFVDGLDEFDGDHAGLVSLFKDLIQNNSIKLCVSSRPWVVFEDAFEQTSSLRLQDLTYLDIKLYVSSRINGDPGFDFLFKREPDYAMELVENIVEKASGVFLWVKLAVSSILGGLGHGDRICDLQKRLDALPGELENLYDGILLSLDPFYLEHAAQLFNFVQRSTEPPSVQILVFADDDNCWQRAIERKVEPISLEEADVMQETLRRRINSRCKGFLEIDKKQKLSPTQEPSDSILKKVPETGHKKPMFELTNTLAPSKSQKSIQERRLDSNLCTVQYLHRTVKDYIESPKVHQKLQSAMKSPYDFNLRQSAALLSLIKCRLVDKCFLKNDSKFWDQIDRFLRFASKILPENTPQMLELVDELDRSCSILAKQNAKHFPRPLSEDNFQGPEIIQYLELGQWVASSPLMEPVRHLRTNILTLAVYYNIFEYVEARASYGCLVQLHKFSFGMPREAKTIKQASPKTEKIQTQLATGFLHSLLSDAFELSPSSDYIHNRSRLDDSPDTKLKMILFLLKKGANPNHRIKIGESYTENTVWESVIEQAGNELKKGISVLFWFRVLKLLLEHGAGQFFDKTRKENIEELDLLLYVEVGRYRTGKLEVEKLIGQLSKSDTPRRSWLPSWKVY